MKPLAYCALALMGMPLSDCPPPREAKGPWELPALSVESHGMSHAPDFTCLGQRASAPAGGELSLSLGVTPFGAPPTVRVPGLHVQFFPSGRPQSADACGPECIAATADASGTVQVSLPHAGPLSYRVLPAPGPDPARSFLRTVEYGFLPPTPERPEWLNTITEATLSGLVAAAGNRFDTDRGVLSGRLLDCADRPVAGGWLRVFAADGSEIQDREGGAQRVYFDGALPPGIDPEASFTALDGRWAAANIPAGAVRIEAWGLLPGDRRPSLLSCEAVDSFAGSLSVVALRPLDAEPASGCGTKRPMPKQRERKPTSAGPSQAP